MKAKQFTEYRKTLREKWRIFNLCKKGAINPESDNGHLLKRWTSKTCAEVPIPFLSFHLILDSIDSQFFLHCDG